MSYFHNECTSPSNYVDYIEYVERERERTTGYQYMIWDIPSRLVRNKQNLAIK